MLVLSMNSKRQRRPNVRLGDIGDVSAAFSCGTSHKTKENLELKSWKHDVENNPIETAFNPICGFSMIRSSELGDSDPCVAVPPLVSADIQHNRENRNPNSSKSVFEFPSLDENNASKPKLDFGTVTRKGRVMKRRGRSMRCNNSGFYSAWNSRVSAEISNEDGKGYAGDEFVGITSNSCYDALAVDGLKDSSDRESLDTCKEACEDEWAGPISDLRLLGNSNELRKEDACDEGDGLYSEDGPSVDPKSCGGYESYDMMGIGGSTVHSVRRWLEELGLGKYACIFEIHEVDEEALPLLTFEDLKEMGINAVGIRRKMYSAIQHLREERGLYV
ncbi:hypothetical protein HHK36_024411 [Tetracentron sinense]|uniref:SAM domain-containing protein n=1 Tax=Tetracentron sinense TaxID=13715 RepID=A0A835D483_TETSI|nr:hypothetical protein HHK36_024411 [Tetracentron sinense]